MNRMRHTSRSVGVAAVTRLFGLAALAPPAGLIAGAPLTAPSAAAARPPLTTPAVAPPTSADDRAPADFAGRWQGTLSVGGNELRIVFHIRTADDGGLTSTLDSPDQGAAGIPVTTTTVDGDSLRLDIAAASAVYAGRLVEGGDAIEGEWRQAGQTLPLTVERTEEGAPGAGEGKAATRRPQDPGPPLPYRQEQVEIDVRAADVTLAGTLTLPAGDAPAPAVVLVSGSGPQDRDGTLAGHRPFLVLADHLTRRGVAVLRTDDRGVDGSTGSTFATTLEDRAGDLVAAVRFLRERPGIDRHRIGVLGHSEGGWVVPLAATEAPDEIAFVVMLAGPAQSPRDLLLSQQRAMLRAEGADEAKIAALDAFLRGNLEIIRTAPDTAVARARLAERRDRILTELPDARRRALEAYFAEQSDAARDRALWVANTGWFRDLVAFDPAPSLRAMDQPVLALFGADDVQVPVDENAPAMARLLDADGRPDRTVRVLPGLNHLFQPGETGLPSEYAAIDTTMSAAALEAVGGWIIAVVGR